MPTGQLGVVTARRGVRERELRRRLQIEREIHAEVNARRSKAE
jgi:hypothetical protein